MNNRYSSYCSLLACSALVIGWSAVKPRDYDVWIFEIWPGLLGLLTLGLLLPRLTFSKFNHVLIGIHIAILALGAKYTYAEMPLFDYLKDALGFSRNYYDRVGHFAQGFVPALICREILLRTTPLKPGKMLSFLCIAVCLGLSAFWELIEMWVVQLFYPAAGPSWLGMQGDLWDAQHDMLMALIGATLAIAFLSRLHDRALAKLDGETNALC